jgi:hypothetical protein
MEFDADHRQTAAALPGRTSEVTLLGGATVRIGHYSNAAEQGAYEASALIGTAESFAPVPSFWSDLHVAVDDVEPLPRRVGSSGAAGHETGFDERGVRAAQDRLQHRRTGHQRTTPAHLRTGGGPSHVPDRANRAEAYAEPENVDSEREHRRAGQISSRRPTTAAESR